MKPPDKKNNSTSPSATPGATVAVAATSAIRSRSRCPSHESHRSCEQPGQAAKWPGTLTV